MDLPGFGERLRKIDILDRTAERRRKLFERGLGLAIGLVPHRRAHEGETRRQGRRLVRERAEIGGGERPSVGIGRIVAGDHLEDQR